MKPALREILTAMEGVIQAGIAIVKEGHSTFHPLADLSVRASSLIYDVRLRLLQNSSPVAARQDHAAKTCLDFLGNAENRSILNDHPEIVLTTARGDKAGTVRALNIHIDKMLRRESRFLKPRTVEKMDDNGMLTKKFTASYLKPPKPVKPVVPKEPVDLPRSFTRPARKAAAPVQALV